MEQEPDVGTKKTWKTREVDETDCSCGIVAILESHKQSLSNSLRKPQAKPIPNPSGKVAIHSWISHCFRSITREQVEHASAIVTDWRGRKIKKKNKREPIM